jgi:hypothetical protein
MSEERYNTHCKLRNIFSNQQFVNRVAIMSRDVYLPHPALKYDVEVQENGRVELTVPFSPGARIAVFVVEEANDFSDLMAAAQSSLDFWDNPYDDEDWNHAPAR